MSEAVNINPEFVGIDPQEYLQRPAVREFLEEQIAERNAAHQKAVITLEAACRAFETGNFEETVKQIEVFKITVPNGIYSSLNNYNIIGIAEGGEVTHGRMQATRADFHKFHATALLGASCQSIEKEQYAKAIEYLTKFDETWPSVCYSPEEFFKINKGGVTVPATKEEIKGMYVIASEPAAMEVWERVRHRTSFYGFVGEEVKMWGSEVRILQTCVSQGGLDLFRRIARDEIRSLAFGNANPRVAQATLDRLAGAPGSGLNF